ncbi:MAG: hypothetical protein RE468_12170 [Acidithiobacillus caldus]|nr:transposase [Acidithiobacillus caldus]WMT46630.1 MAG: hypothetical protein RE468_12170 [Acidithiobacillus caldus]
MAQFFAWVEEQLLDTALLPSNPFTKALAYVHSRKGSLQVFLEDPEVPIGRVEMWRGGGRCGLSVSVPFV